MAQQGSDVDCTTCACPRASLADDEVVTRVRAGETALFEMIMRKYNQRLYRVARAILRDDGEAEDVMLQANVNAYSHLDQFAGLAKFSTWLTQIAVHEALARARRRARLKGLESMLDETEEPTENAGVWASGSETWLAISLPGDHSDLLRDGTPDPERQAHTAELRQLLESAIDSLPGLYRSVFVLREAEGLDTPEVAECLEISQETVRTRLHRARTLLRRYIYESTGATSGSAFSFHLSRCDRVVSGVLGHLGLPQAPPRLH